MKLGSAALISVLCFGLQPATLAGQEAFTIQPLPKSDKELKERFTASQSTFSR